MGLAPSTLSTNAGLTLLGRASFQELGYSNVYLHADRHVGWQKEDECDTARPTNGYGASGICLQCVANVGRPLLYGPLSMVPTLLRCTVHIHIVASVLGNFAVHLGPDHMYYEEV